MQIVEGSAFVAAPLGGMTLAQLGADVIRFDPVGGGLDRNRWPLTGDGKSLFWAGLNKGKRSIRIDLKSPEGQDIASRLITRPGADRGFFLTNLPQRGALSYAALKGRREDLVMVQLAGNADGTSEVDYTVNVATGFPEITGPRGGTEPVNSGLPVWDIAMGQMAALGLLAADRHRSRTGKGSLVKLALSEGRLVLSVNNPDSGSATEEIGVDYPAEAIEIGFNAKYLLDVAGQLETGTAEFRFADPGSPTLIQDADTPNALYVLMPMRV